MNDENDVERQRRDWLAADEKLEDFLRVDDEETDDAFEEIDDAFEEIDDAFEEIDEEEVDVRD